MANPSIRLDDREFTTVLQRRLDAHFRRQNLSRKGDSRMMAKVVGGLTLSFATYAALYVFPMNAWQFFLAYLLHGLTHLFLLLNVAHDSNHYAVSKNRFANRALPYVFDLFGINSYMWRVLHNRGHHPNINVCGEDEDVMARGYLRFSPYVPRKPIHRFQHIYAWLLYGLSTFDYVLLKDFQYFFATDYRRAREMKHPLKEYVILFGTKLFYYTYMLILPVVILHRAPLLVFLAFLCSHFLVGLIAQFIFQTTHAIEASYFPQEREDINNYVLHILATTADYSTEGSVADWFLGGLNHHVAHHLCPDVCHIHYAQLTRIVKETASEYGIPYRANTTIWQAVRQHFSHLKRMGQPLGPAVAQEVHANSR
jgi:linoleoyl-CoA desaturase